MRVRYHTAPCCASLGRHGDPRKPRSALTFEERFALTVIIVALAAWGVVLAVASMWSSP